MRRRVIALALFVIFSGSMVSLERVLGEESTPASTTLLAAAAPFGLGAASLPDTRAGVVALFDCLPHEVDGETQYSVPVRSDGRVIVSYGEPDPSFGPPLTLQALNFEEGDFFPRDFTAGLFVTSAGEAADVGTVAFGRDGNLAWMRAMTTAGVAGDDRGTPEMVQPLYTVAWGEVESSWLYTAAAFTPEGLETLVTAFVAAASQEPSTPRAGC